MPLSGLLQVPGDKSISHRALMFSALVSPSHEKDALSETQITGLLDSADVGSTRSCLSQLGVSIEGLPHETVRVRGALPFSLSQNTLLDVGNSGTSIRLLSGLLAGALHQTPYAITLTGDASIQKRPMGRVIRPLKEMGAGIRGEDSDRFAPLTITSAPAGLQGIRYSMPMASAQVKSAILLAGLFASGETSVVEPIPSRDHTERMLQAMGVPIQVSGSKITLFPNGLEHIRSVQWDVPGDISSAAFWMVAASLIPQSHICLTRVGLNPRRTGIVEVLKRMGAVIQSQNNTEACGEPVGDLRVQAADLHGHITVRAEEIPTLIDEIPILAVAGVFLEGTLTVTGAEELRAKESDRLEAMATEFQKLGIAMTMAPDGFILKGNPEIRISQPNTPLESYHDHRIAMALTILNQIHNHRHGIEEHWPIQHKNCVKISYPTFFEHLHQLEVASLSSLF